MLEDDTVSATASGERMGFVIWCANTVCEDGSELRNDAPVRGRALCTLAAVHAGAVVLSCSRLIRRQAPEFVIATLEERTGIRRPDNASACRLDDINLFFTSGGAIVPTRAAVSAQRGASGAAAEPS